MGQFLAAIIEGRDVQRFTPIPSEEARGALRITAALGLPLLEEGRKPQLIKAVDAPAGAFLPLLVERARLVELQAGGKRIFVRGGLNQLPHAALAAVAPSAPPRP